VQSAEGTTVTLSTRTCTACCEQMNKAGYVIQSRPTVEKINGVAITGNEKVGLHGPQVGAKHQCYVGLKFI